MNDHSEMHIFHLKSLQRQPKFKSSKRDLNWVAKLSLLIRPETSLYPFDQHPLSYENDTSNSSSTSWKPRAWPLVITPLCHGLNAHKWGSLTFRVGLDEFSCPARTFSHSHTHANSPNGYVLFIDGVKWSIEWAWRWWCCASRRTLYSHSWGN